jgi:hypothetical protein
MDIASETRKRRQLQNRSPGGVIRQPNKITINQRAEKISFHEVLQHILSQGCQN